MDIQRIIDQLTKPQLEDLLGRVHVRLAELDAEASVPLWVIVEDRVTNIAAFTDEQYPQAVARMIAEVERAARENPRTPISLELRRFWYPQSQVDTMLAISRQPSSWMD